jgi:hypothetical protein
MIGKLGPGNKEFIDKYSYVNRTIKLWNQLTAEGLATYPCRSHIFKKRARKVIIREVKWRDLKRDDKKPKSGGK